MARRARRLSGTRADRRVASVGREEEWQARSILRKQAITPGRSVKPVQIAQETAMRQHVDIVPDWITALVAAFAGAFVFIFGDIGALVLALLGAAVWMISQTGNHSSGLSPK